MAKEKHPSQMPRIELERELLAQRAMTKAFAECLEHGELAVTLEGKDRLQAARATVLTIYGLA